MPAATHYTILGVPRTATADEVKRAYRALARLLHPDVNTASDAAVRFAAVQGAYALLSDRRRRAEYDRQLDVEEAQPGQHSRRAHFTWTNIATHVTRADTPPERTDLDEMYDAYFGGRTI